MAKTSFSFVKVLIIVSVVLFCVVVPSFGANFDMVLQWNENSEPDLAAGGNPRYKIYYKTGSSGQGSKANYVGLPASEPDQADEGASPVGVTVAMDENTDPGTVQYTLHNLEDSQDYYIAVTALDESGNESELSNEVFYQGVTSEPINEAPSLAFFYINGAENSETVYTNNGSGEVQFRIVASDTDGIVAQYLILDNASDPGNQAFMDIPEGGGASVDFTGQFTLSGGGSHTLYAWVKDDQGTISAANSKTNVVLDLTVPDAPGTPDLASSDDTGASDADNVTNQTSSLSLSGIGERNSVVQLYDGTTPIGSPATVTYYMYRIDIALLPGTHSITARQTDLAGNVSESSAPLSLVVDTTPPTGQISLSSAQTAHVDIGELGITATFNEDTASTPQIEISGGGVLDVNAEAMAGSGMVWTKNLMVPKNDNTAYTITVSNITDIAGNVSQSLTSNFTTDTIDTDNDTIRDFEDTDDDNDSMPDTWEIAFGLDPKVNDALLDGDGDGVSNLDEFLLEMDPSSPDENLSPKMPVRTAPEDNEVVSIMPALEIAEFEDYNRDDTHSETEWQIFVKGDENADAVYELRNGETLTTLVVPESILAYETSYSWRARVFDNHGAASEWCAFNSFSTEVGPENEIPVVQQLSVDEAEGDTPVYTNNATVSVAINASDADGTITQYLILADESDPSNGVFKNIPGGADATVGFNVEILLEADGIHSIYAWVVDDDGDISLIKTKTNVHLDRTPPGAPTLKGLLTAGK